MLSKTKQRLQFVIHEKPGSLYSIKLDELFDIAHAHANYLIQFEEDRQFQTPLSSAYNRSGSIGGYDSSRNMEG